MRDDRAAAVARELLRESHSRARIERFRYAGTSMHPFLVDGDILSIATDLAPAIGDTVVFESDGAFVAHRYLLPWRAEDAPALLIKADNRFLFDPPVALSRIVGPVRSVLRAENELGVRGATYRIRAVSVACVSLAEGILYALLRTANRRLRIFAGPNARVAAERLVSLPRAVYRLLSARGVA